MPKYHVNDKGEVGTCRAKKRCPFGDIDLEHFSSKEEARKYYESVNEMEQRASLVKKFPQHPATTRALAAPLDPIDIHTDWLDEMAEDGERLFGEKPVVVDVVDTPAGRAAVVWENHSTRDFDVSTQLQRGYGFSRLVVRTIDEGKLVGYVTASFVDDNSLKLSFGDDQYSGLRYCAASQGRSFGMKVYSKNFDGPAYDPFTRARTEEEILEVKRNVWAAAYNDFKIAPEWLPKDHPGRHSWGGVDLKPEHAPADVEVLEADLKRICEVADERYEEHRLNHKPDWASVDYSKVDDEFRGQGLGTSLYVYTARMLARNGKALRSSDTQSDEAQRAWARMAADGDLPVKRIVSVYRTGGVIRYRTPHFLLDFRP